MQRNVMTRLVLAVLVAGASIILLALSVHALSGTLDISKCAGSLGCGWIVPLVTALIIGAVVWVLLGQLPKTRGGTPSNPSPADGPLGGPSCPECGSAVMASWRLCPGCGYRLDG